ncbi:hypothetical protein CNMCM5623_001412 [Aspergillus felis]|uniref:Haloacid dehalogenase-like hydrolase n=1 Tax=Aspergillus felis TaxID=1287682 RepID=A0A8H6UMJ7_9EURO|nr:hypothetical protein CNMCM5623_001412 [Aspergillus felis]
MADLPSSFIITLNGTPIAKNFESEEDERIHAGTDGNNPAVFTLNDGLLECDGWYLGRGLIEDRSMLPKPVFWHKKGAEVDVASIQKTAIEGYGEFVIRNGGHHDSFSNITRNSLRHAVAEHGEKLDEGAIDELLRAYDSLSTFPDVQPTLSQLANRPDITAVVFSNGTQAMVTNSVRDSPDLSPHSAVFKQIITVDEVRQFKPAPAVYAHLAQKMGKSPSSQMADLWLVSGNPFDVIGARSCGMHAIWVDRARRGWMDAAVPDLQPTAVVHDLNDILTVIQ